MHGLFRSLWLGLALTAVVACGSAADAPGAPAPGNSFQSVTPSDQLFILDDFKATGFKIAKEYSAEGLTAATSAWFGFWRPEGSDAKEYEARFYASHEDAPQFGTSFAEEGAGASAILDEEDATWNEGVKDRRYFFAGPIGSHGSGKVQPKYGGYSIYGNMVLLCEGANPTQ